jgi:hypothetical protein
MPFPSTDSSQPLLRILNRRPEFGTSAENAVRDRRCPLGATLWCRWSRKEPNDNRHKDTDPESHEPSPLSSNQLSWVNRRLGIESIQLGEADRRLGLRNHTEFESTRKHDNGALRLLKAVGSRIFIFQRRFIIQIEGSVSRVFT